MSGQPGDQPVLPPCSFLISLTELWSSEERGTHQAGHLRLRGDSNSSLPFSLASYNLKLAQDFIWSFQVFFLGDLNL